MESYMGEAPVAEIEPLTYTIDEAGKLLGISRWGAYEAARRGEIPTLKIWRLIHEAQHRTRTDVLSRRRLIAVEELDRFMTGRVDQPLSDDQERRP